MRQSLVFLVIGLSGAVAVAQQQPAPSTATFALTVDSIMRGPSLVGYPPSDLRWSGDSKELYFERRTPGEDEAATWVVGRDGGAHVADAGLHVGDGRGDAGEHPRAVLRDGEEFDGVGHRLGVKRFLNGCKILQGQRDFQRFSLVAVIGVAPFDQIHEIKFDSRRQ